MNRFSPFITVPDELPGVSFNSQQAILMCCRDALEIERIITEFERDGNEFALAVDLEPFGFNRSEIAEIVAAPHVRLQMMYATL